MAFTYRPSESEENILQEVMKIYGFKSKATALSFLVYRGYQALTNNPVKLHLSSLYGIMNDGIQPEPLIGKGGFIPLENNNK